MYFGLFDPTMYLLIPAIILALWAQTKVSSTFNKYSKIANARGLTGSDAARMILDKNVVAVQADEADLSGGQQGQHTIQHTHAGAEDRHQRQLAACQHLGLCHGDGSLDLHLFQRQVTGRFVAQQGRDLANEVTELLGAGLLVAQNAQLVLQQRMLNDHRGHKNTLLILNR